MFLTRADRLPASRPPEKRVWPKAIGGTSLRPHPGAHQSGGWCTTRSRTAGSSAAARRTASIICCRTAPARGTASRSTATVCRTGRRAARAGRATRSRTATARSTAGRCLTAGIARCTAFGTARRAARGVRTAVRISAGAAGCVGHGRRSDGGGSKAASDHQHLGVGNGSCHWESPLIQLKTLPFPHRVTAEKGNGSRGLRLRNACLRG